MSNVGSTQLKDDYSSQSGIRCDVANLFYAPNREPVSESARKLLHVEKNGSMALWDGDLVPYMTEPMNCLKSLKYNGLIFVGPARTSKTVSLIDGWICDTIVNNPSDFLLVQISQEKAAEFSKKRLNRAFNASPEIRAAMSPRGHDNNVHDKVFRAGNFLKIAWPSKNILASSDWKYIAMTDYDRMTQDVDGEGSPFLLGLKRAQTFMSSGMTLAESSPGFNVIDPTYRVKSAHEAPPTLGILALYNQGDRRLFHWQCPECRQWFEPEFSLLEWDRNISDPALASKEVFLACPCCGSLLADRTQPNGYSLKYTLNQSGIWIPEGCKADVNGIISGTPRDTRIASFWQKGPCAAFQSWNELVYKYLSALQHYEKTGDLSNLKTTVNTDQGKPFLPPRKTDQNANMLISRKAEIGKKTVPEWVRFLTASIDIQGGKKTARFEVLVLGWGVELECQIIDRFKIEKSRRIDGDNPDKFVRVNPAGYLEDWHVLIDKVIKKSYPLENSEKRMGVHLTACDSGGEDGVTDNAYSFYRKLKKSGVSRKFILVKGRSMGDKIFESFPDNSNRSDRKAKAYGDVPVYLLNTNLIKDTIFAALEREQKGRRYIHFPSWLPDSFFDELLAEERNTLGKYIKISDRNETLDLFVYCWGCIYKLKAEKIDWERPPSYAVEQAVNFEILDSEDQEVPIPQKRRRRSSF